MKSADSAPLADEAVAAGTWKVPAAWLGVVCVWSTTPLAIKWSAEGAGVLFGVASRMVLGVAVFMGVYLARGRRLPVSAAAFKVYAAPAVGIFGGMMFVYWGSSYIPSGLIAVIFGLAPVLTAVMAGLWLRERALTAPKIIGSVLGVGGLALIFRGELLVGGDGVYGVLAVLMAVTLNSLSTVLTKRWGVHWSAMDTTAGGLLLSTFGFVSVWALAGVPVPAAVDTRTVLSIAYLGVAGSVLGFLMYFFVLKHVPASRVVLITLITPVTAMLLGTTFNEETLPAMTWYGTGVILAGLLFHYLGETAMSLGVRRQRKTGRS